MTELAIDGVTALVHQADGSVAFAENTTIAIDGIITSVGEPAEAAEHIDGSGLVALPGFINTHTHSPMVLFRGSAENIPLERWFNEFIWPMEVNLTPRDVELGARLAIAEMIQAGVTTFADHYFEMPTIARVVEETGIRANLGATFFSSGGERAVDEGLEFALEYAGAAGGRITTSLAPHATYTVTDDDLRRTGELGREHDLLVHVHAGESRPQTLHHREQHGISPVQTLERLGILEGRTLIAHGVGIVPEDYPALAAAATRTGVGVAPRGYLKESTDTTPVRALLALGVAVGLATDGAASNNTLDVWEAMNLLTLTQKAVERDPTWMTPAQALGVATLGSARALGLAGQVGSLAVGHRADIILVDLSSPRTQPIHDLASTLVHSGRSSDVVTTIVDGRVLMRDRQLLTIDVPELLAELRPRLAALTNRDHGQRIQDYNA
jgi:5-methylthioadenosine/S-adenosylhomocysteine deaminase